MLVIMFRCVANVNSQSKYWNLLLSTDNDIRNQHYFYMKPTDARIHNSTVPCYTLQNQQTNLQLRNGNFVLCTQKQIDQYKSMILILFKVCQRLYDDQTHLRFQGHGVDEQHKIIVSQYEIIVGDLQLCRVQNMYTEIWQTARSNRSEIGFLSILVAKQYHSTTW